MKYHVLILFSKSFPTGSAITTQELTFRRKEKAEEVVLRIQKVFQDYQSSVQVITWEEEDS
jgi:ABC-type dipeptide/oligopeptide/nickel transport system ATPase subunit